VSRADRSVRPGSASASTAGGAARSAQAEWNVVATVKPGEFVRAKSLLERFGRVHATEFFNVLVFSVENVRAFMTEYAARAEIDPRLDECIARVAPALAAFDFDTPGDFELKARRVAIELAPDLAGKSFHVRMNRRGFKGRLSSQSEEQQLDVVLLEELQRLGAPGRITFDDPDAILDVETVDGRAGLSLWTREDLARFPFLKID
jgi:tRNA(Ser,Leu) C12 N-acetylase TAN1